MAIISDFDTMYFLPYLYSHSSTAGMHLLTPPSSRTLCGVNNAKLLLLKIPKIWYLLILHFYKETLFTIVLIGINNGHEIVHCNLLNNGLVRYSNGGKWKHVQSWPYSLYRWLSRCSTPRGSSMRFSLVGPTKVKACKYKRVFNWSQTSVLIVLLGD